MPLSEWLVVLGSVGRMSPTSQAWMSVGSGGPRTGPPGVRGVHGGLGAPGCLQACAVMVHHDRAATVQPCH